MGTHGIMSIPPCALRTVCETFSAGLKASSFSPGSKPERCHSDSGYDSASDEEDIISIRIHTEAALNWWTEATVSRSAEVHASVQTELGLAHDAFSVMFCGDCVGKGTTFDDLGCEDDSVLDVHDDIQLPRHLERLLARIQRGEGSQTADKQLAEVVAKRLSRDELSLLAGHIEGMGLADDTASPMCYFMRALHVGIEMCDEHDNHETTEGAVPRAARGRLAPLKLLQHRSSNRGALPQQERTARQSVGVSRRPGSMPASCAHVQVDCEQYGQQ